MQLNDNNAFISVSPPYKFIAEILKEAETYLWRIKEEMRCS